jgi:lysophospholipase L1-like esterase
MLAMAAVAAPIAPVASASTAPRYLLALGDSLAAGYQPIYATTLPPVDVVSGFRDIGYPSSYAAGVAAAQGLQLVDLGCPGETSTSMLGAPAIGQCTALYKAEFRAKSQMSAALDFISAHLGQVSLVTLDIGANDLDKCFSTSQINGTCLKNTDLSVIRNLSSILSTLTTELRKSDPGVRLIGMNYYDPFLGLAYTPGGTHGAELAVASVAATDTLNVELTATFRRFGAARADVASGFRTDNLLPLARFAGRRYPIDVVEVCTWTWMCPRTATGGQDVHPNVAGYRVITSAFNRAITS